jgi:hypothetical protein
MIGIKKTQNFMLVSKIQPSISEKINLKKVIPHIPTIFDESPNLACYFLMNFLGAFCHQGM